MYCNIYNLNELDNYKYVVVLSEYNGKILLSRHKKRATWETQGGHIEEGESPIETARRELFEESGIRDAEIIPVCDYYGYDATSHANGMVFAAIVHELGSLPDSEMAEVKAFDHFPEELSYPFVTPVLFEECRKRIKRSL